MSRDTSQSDAPSQAETETVRADPPSAPAAAWGQSDVGRVRELNEDNWHWEALSDELVLYAVADGMGGHDRGEVASQVAVESLFKAASAMTQDADTDDLAGLREVLRDAMQFANRSVVAAGEAQDSNMGTTLCAALMVREKDALIANVGDSRAYLLREGRLEVVSQDHSLVAYLVQLGELTPEQARNHPSGNILVRSIGSVAEVDIDVYHRELKAGDRIVLCSDGLWGEVPDDEIHELLASNESPQDACRALVNAANDNGGRDNTTLIVVNV